MASRKLLDTRSVESLIRTTCGVKAGELQDHPEVRAAYQAHEGHARAALAFCTAHMACHHGATCPARSIGARDDRDLASNLEHGTRVRAGHRVHDLGVAAQQVVAIRRRRRDRWRLLGLQHVVVATDLATGEPPRWS